jgi:3-methylfumaryl-CoA hydratase
MDTSMDFSKWLGLTRRASDGMGHETLKRFEATMDRDASVVLPGQALPPCAHWFYFTPLEPCSALASDGHPHKGDFLPDAELPRRMWAGGIVKFPASLHADTQATKISTVASITPKQGSTGPLCFVTVAHQIHSQGRLCIEEEQHIVYRDAPPKSDPPRRVKRFENDALWSDEWTPTAVELFRFSAITFNGHRIHYDADYCRDVEGYPDLVVHGPLLVHRILDAFARHRPGSEVKMIDYRAVGPVYLGETVKVIEAIPSENSQGFAAHLYIIGHEGSIAMQARIEYHLT